MAQIRSVWRRFRTGQDRAYLTFAGQLGWKGRNLAVTWTKRNTNNMTALNDTDTRFQVSAGHAFDFGLTTDVGWKVSEDAGVKTRAPGALAKICDRILTKNNHRACNGTQSRA